MQLNSADKKILTLLQGDGRKTIQALSEAVGLSPHPAFVGSAFWRMRR